MHLTILGQQPLFPVLEYFRIYGLHGRHDVSLDFAGETTIFIADNGAGKTTSLYFLQAILSGQFSKLKRFRYTKVELKFANSVEFAITPKDYDLSRHISALKAITQRTDLDEDQVFELVQQARHMPYEVMRDRSLLMSVSRQMRLPTKIMYERLIRIDHSRFIENDWAEQLDNHSINALKSYLEKEFSIDVLYLPTYRRVEQGIEHVFEADAGRGELKNSDIHFGMKDVEQKIQSATSQIRDHFIKSYGQISGQMLGQLVESRAVSPEMQARLADRSAIELVLSRVGSNVSESQRRGIMQQYDSGKLNSNRHLAFFLSRLIEAYDQVKGLDDSLQAYARVCNGYLTNKHMRYDSLSGTLQLYEDITDGPIDLDNLSSGEKQILGVMADLYLGRQRHLAVIFDEPELSLSVEWQRKILLDIAASEKCAFLVAATHSPFVFENSLDSFARSLRVRYNPVQADSAPE